jgi:hypothetical protein
LRYWRVGGTLILSIGRKNLKRENCSKSRTVPTRPVHALLAAIELEDSLTVKDLPSNLTEFYNELGFLPKPKRDNKPKRLLQKISFANQNHRQTRTPILENLTLPKSDNAKKTEIILQTQFAKTFATKRQANFENLQNQP